MIANFFRVIVGLTGLLLLYVGLFLTETEEGGLQNRLEELWVRVDDLQSRAMTRQAAFLQQVSGLVAHGLAKLFGHKLFSVKSLATCLCFSMASTDLSVVLFAKGELLPHLKLTLVIFSLVLLILGVSQRLRYLGFVYLGLAWLIELVAFPGSLKLYQVRPGELISGAVIYVVGILSVVGFIALTRWSLGLGSSLSNTAGISAVILLNIALGGTLIAPLIFKELHHYEIVLFDPTRVGTSLVSRPHGLMIFLYGVTETNLFTAAVAFVVVLALLAALAHRLVWPAISRLVYAAHRYGLIRQHKFLVALGGACLLFAWPNNVVIKAIAKVIGLGA